MPGVDGGGAPPFDAADHRVGAGHAAGCVEIPCCYICGYPNAAYGPCDHLGTPWETAWQDESEVTPSSSVATGNDDRPAIALFMAGLRADDRWFCAGLRRLDYGGMLHVC